jgi:hypothetical protein
MPSLTQPTILATASVTVDGKSSPWSPTINPTLDFGVHDGTGPCVVPVAIAAGDIITFEATGAVDVSDGRPPYGPDGGGFVTAALKGPNGTYFPTKHIPNASLQLAGLCGSFTDDAGVVIETFAVGKRTTLTVPVGATKPVLGVNDDQYSDNSGSYLVNVTVADAPQPEVDGIVQALPTQRSFVESGHHAHGVKACYLGSDNIVNMSYSDDAGHIWYGDAELFAIVVQDSADQPVTVLISPSSADVAAGSQKQFTATVSGTLDKDVAWSVDVIVGGNSAVGFISANGLYTAPTFGGIHTIKATSLADPTAFDTVPVNVVGADVFGDVGSFVSATPKSAIKQIAGEATIIRTDAFSIVWSSGQITNYIARNFPISDPGATPVVKYVTIYDPNKTGDASGTLPAFIDDTAARALSSDDYVFVGKIIATQEGGNTGSDIGPSGLSQVLATVGSSGMAVQNPFGNNTSASSDYKWDSSDALIRSNFLSGQAKDKSFNPSPRNTSKRDLHEMLASPTTKTIMHAMPWFGPSRPHIDVGYNSDTDAQASAQVADMKSRGIDIVQAYINPRDAFTYSAAQRLLAACVAQGVLFNLCYTGTSFASGGSAQVISDFANFNTDFFGSSAYHKWGGRPVVFMFDSTGATWATVRAGISGLSHGNPALIFRNKSGRTVSESQGCFAWNDPSAYDAASDPGAIGYLNDFYSNVHAAGAVAAGEFVCGSMYPGFDGRLTAGKNTNGGTGTGWSLPKHIDRQKNKTWRQCAAAANAVFNASTFARTLPFMLVDTWSDYEEGSATETGIESGITIAAAIANNVLTWSTAGDEGGVARYVISRSPAGLTTPLTTITTVAVGATKSVNLAALAAGSYNIFVIAEGIPMTHNESATVAFTRP